MDKDLRLYINRELSWLMFNDRVLDEAYDKERKIFTRLKFLAITASNLDEFFMVRVAGIKQQLAAKYTKKDISGRTPEEQLRAIEIETHQMMKKMYSCLNKSLLPELALDKIHFKTIEQLNERQRLFVDDFFDEYCFPSLTPLAVDVGRPFPLLQNKSINIAVILNGDTDNELFGVVQVPSVLPRFIDIHSEENGYEFIFLEDIILSHLNKLFDGYKIIDSLVFRITRDADLDINEDEAEDLLIQIEKNIKRRRWGAPVRLEIQKKAGKNIKKILKKRLEISDEEIYELSGHLDLSCWFDYIINKKMIHLLDEMPVPQKSVDFQEEEDIFEAIRKKDRMLHLPYESFDKVLEFIDLAVKDPQVLAIKQTLYRVSKNSPIIDKLIQAAENGKQVTVVVELKARFDEANNIIWARKLEKAGCHVVYGFPNLKIHCKALLVVRKEEDGIRRYVHLSTGNYNEFTARIYEDIGLFTCKNEICKDISNLFNVITGFTRHKQYNKIFAAPADLRSGFEYFINREIRNAQSGKKAYMIIKINSLVDKQIINKLYEASEAGVHVELMIRGICCLVPGIQGVSDNITVRSIVGTFLEHSRIYYFYNNDNPEIYLSSADWMERNLDRRIEVLFPVEESSLKERITGILDIELADTEKTRIQQNDGTYKKMDRRGKEAIEAQKVLHEKAINDLKK
jgi:polyphosphate kinase